MITDLCCVPCWCLISNFARCKDFLVHAPAVEASSSGCLRWSVLVLQCGSPTLPPASPMLPKVMSFTVFRSILHCLSFLSKETIFITSVNHGCNGIKRFRPHTIKVTSDSFQESMFGCFHTFLQFCILGEQPCCVHASSETLKPTEYKLAFKTRYR